MFVTLFIVGLTLLQEQPDKPVTNEEKKEFFKLLAQLPTQGEFFTDEGIKQAIPYTRVLLALTEKDIDANRIYPLLALSGGLMNCKEPRQLGISHFSKIAHPTIKMFWAIGLLQDTTTPPEVLRYLRSALDSKSEAKEMSSILGPDFQGFKEEVIKRFEMARQTKVEFIRQHVTELFPAYGGFVGSYTMKNTLWGPDQILYAVHPMNDHGELIAFDLKKGKYSRSIIPQPRDVKGDLDSGSSFDNPVLTINADGDLFCRWTFNHNGNHVLALRKNGSDAFITKSITNMYLSSSYVAAGRDGIWYLFEGGNKYALHQIDKDLNLTHVGDFAGKGHHSIHISDARFISKGLLHIFWADVTGGNYLQIRCVDFDVREKRWLHNREISRLDKFVSDASSPTILQFQDDSLHYVWRVNEGQNKSDSTGVYYQPERTGQTTKIAVGYEYRAIAVGTCIVVCYTLEKSPEKVYFQVINYGVPGPVSELVVNQGEKYPLRLEKMILHSAGEKLFFVNTRTPHIVYELKLVDMMKK